MRRALKAFLATVLVAATSGLAFYLGGVLGYAQGVGTALGRSAPFNAIERVHLLKQLRRGETAEAIDNLEILLDTDILAHVLVAGSKPSPFRRDEAADDPSCLMRLVARYRDSHPSSSPVTRDAVNRYLKLFREPPRTALARRLTRHCS